MTDDELTASRRDILKTGAVAGVGLGGGSGVLSTLQPADESGEAVDQVTSFLGEDQVVKTACGPNCRGDCPLDVFVRDGQIKKTEQQVPAASEFKRGCTLGISHVQRAYNAKRLKYPMKRASWSPDDPQPGARGEDAQFERISWSEALDLVAEQIQTTKGEYGPESVYWHAGSGSQGTSGYGRLKQLVGGIQDSFVYGIDTNVGQGFNRITGEGGVFMPPTNTVEDWANADTLIIWGSDIFASQFQMDAEWILDAKRNGAKLVVVDPMYTNTAEKADLWLPIRPGKDTHLALAMMNYIFENEVYDDTFLRQRTNAPALVRVDDGTLFDPTRVSDNPPDGGIVVMNEETSEPNVVGAETGGPFALFGEWTIDGVAVRTGLAALREQASEYQPADVAEVAGLSVADIKTAADWLATRGAGGILPAYSVGRYLYGHVFGQAYATLMALTGDYGRHGNVHAQHPSYGGPSLQTGDWGNPEGGVSLDTYGYQEILSLLENGDPVQPRFLYGTNSNMLGNQFPNRERWLNAMESLDTIVWADMYHTPTTQQADIILPAAHWFETEDVLGSDHHPNIRYREQAHEPLWEARDDYYIMAGIAERLGHGDKFPDDKREVLDRFVQNDDRLSWEQLRENGTVETDETPTVAYTDAFGTESGRITVYDDDAPTEKGPGLPDEGISLEVPEPLEARTADDWEAQNEYPLVFMQKHSKWRIHSQWANVPWLREVNREPQLDIHPKDAEQRDISDGEYVLVHNDRGSMVVRAKYNEGIQPGLVNTDQGWWAEDFVEGHYQDPISAETADVGRTFAFYDCRVEVERAAEEYQSNQYTQDNPRGTAGSASGGD
ncbi:molybdopterin-containing oxidoreductase family molybdopterin binding subunit [Halorubrum trapanicum]|uniref:Molybdopterin-containing oxidoreductase family molybdopterin binding subunit n=1 Tax=Halorubrum trapanicum TaxID=29284 RepID=A0A8J7R656_9EURY|nr:molybdopterin-dependent oxidoreductase [Halorubrum trapanicum]MBP1902829.1 molybdopterin-containing oxidoreductase family molybdopterin binding subunit [Halorubrum trapanicum]